MASALLLLLLLSLASAQSFSHQRGLIFSLDNGELCLQSAQCKSRCCHRTDGLSLARCANRAAENQECSPKTVLYDRTGRPDPCPELRGDGQRVRDKSIYGVYYKCPCENGLTCEADKSIVGSITNTNYGICQDPGSSSK
uniref:Colipase n=1 Tax=Chelydra serpentina TaxID=8475 RepID=A0A8C3RYM7_CHESE